METRRRTFARSMSRGRKTNLRNTLSHSTRSGGGAGEAILILILTGALLLS